MADNPYSSEFQVTQCGNHLYQRLLEVAKIYCDDFPDLEKRGPLILVYALETALVGYQSANKDLHDFIEKIAEKFGEEEIDKLREEFVSGPKYIYVDESPKKVSLADIDFQESSKLQR